MRPRSLTPERRALHGALASSPPFASALLAGLERGVILRPPVAVVFAHPDDETLGLGGRLQTFTALRLLQVTDGSPERLDDAHRAGFTSQEAYAQMREQELRRALSVLTKPSCRRRRYGLVDQGATVELVGLTMALVSDLEDAALVFTHPYEGGHPDHDAAAFAVQSACDLLRKRTGRAPLRLEFASYHLGPQGMVTGRFWPDPACDEIRVALRADELARKRAAIACYVTQAGLLKNFPVTCERYRLAPRYAFARPPPPGAALYDGFGFSMTSDVWRRHARVAINALEAAA